MSKKEIKIAKIVIEIAGEKLELTPAQAKELKTILCDLYGGEEHHHHDHWHPRQWTYTYSTPTTWYIAPSTCASTSGYVSASTTETLCLTAT